MSAETEKAKALLQDASRLIDESQESQKTFSREVVQPSLTLDRAKTISRDFGRTVGRTFSVLQAKIEAAGAAVDDVARANENLQARLEETTAEKAELTEANKDLKANLGEAVREKDRVLRLNEELEGRLGDALRRVEELEVEREDEPQPIRPVNLAEQFRTVIEKVGETGMAQPVGGAAVVLKSMDVEVKGLITIRGEETHVVMPTATQAIDPGQLSTLRMSFAKVPVVSSAKPPVNP